MMEVFGVDEAVNRFDTGRHRRDEDRGHDEVARGAFSSTAVKKERDAERHSSERVPAVVDEVGQQSDRPRGCKHHGLHDSGDTEHHEADRNGADTFVRADDRGVHETMGVTVVMVVVVVAFVGAGRAHQQPRVPMRTVMVMLVGPESVTVNLGLMHLVSLGMRLGNGSMGNAEW